MVGQEFREYAQDAFELYLKAFLDAGFVLEGLDEPVPSEEQLVENPSVRRRVSFAEFCCVQAEEAGGLSRDSWDSRGCAAGVWTARRVRIGAGQSRVIGDLEMTSIRANAAAVAEADQVPWYDLIDDVPEPLEDGMQQVRYDHLRILSIIWARDTRMIRNIAGGGTARTSVGV